MVREEAGRLDIAVIQSKVTCGGGQTTAGGGERVPCSLERAAALARKALPWAGEGGGGGEGRPSLTGERGGPGRPSYFQVF